MSETIKDRAKTAWRAFSVQALVALGSMPFWYPIVDATAVAVFGPDASNYLQTALAMAGVLGWIKPQDFANVQKHR